MAWTASRREVVKTSGVGLALAGLVAPVAARATGAGVLIVHDPERPASRALALACTPHANRLVALTGDRVHFWRNALAQRPTSIAGVSRWSDLVLARGIGAEHGLRLRATTRHDDLHAWLIA
jgi:hypothetical protein